MRLMQHGGNIAQAARRYGFAADEMLDLSTGICPYSYPVTPALLDPRDWRALPQAEDEARLIAAARDVYRAPADAVILPAAGSQSLITPLAAVRPPGKVAVAHPSYDEYESAFRRQGHTIISYPAGTAAPPDADYVVAVQPENPTGHRLPPRRWLDVLATLDADNGLLVADEAFADLEPEGSLTPFTGRRGLIVLRSFGKFYGLAGLRLGFAVGHQDDIARLKSMLGPWAVATPALKIAAAALADRQWAKENRRRITRQHQALREVLTRHGITPVGGTELYTLCAVDDAAALQHALASSGIWTRIFDHTPGWIRFGLPGDAAELARLDTALRNCIS